MTVEEGLTIEVTFTEEKALQTIAAIDRVWANCNIHGKRHFQPLHDLAATLRHALNPDPPKEAA